MLAFHRYRKHDSEAWDRIHFSRAEDTFRRLIQRFPSQVPAYDSLARLYMERQIVRTALMSAYTGTARRTTYSYLGSEMLLTRAASMRKRVDCGSYG